MLRLQGARRASAPPHPSTRRTQLDPNGSTTRQRRPWFQCARGLLAAQIRPFVALLIQSGDLQAAGIASAYGSRAGAVGPQCLKLRLHLVACRAVQRPERRTGAMQRSCESSLRTTFRSGQRTPSEGAENTRAFLAALREKCSTEIGAMTGLLLALFEERVDASKAGYELAQKLKRGGGGATRGCVHDNPVRVSRSRRASRSQVALAPGVGVAKARLVATRRRRRSGEKKNAPRKRKRRESVSVRVLRGRSGGVCGLAERDAAAARTGAVPPGRLRERRGVRRRARRLF